MENRPVIHIVGTSCRPEQEAKFNRWYDQVHIPMLFRFPGMTAVRRLKRDAGDGEYPEYLAIYEFADREAFEAFQASPERQAAMEETARTWGEDKFEVIWRVQYEVLGAWQK